MIYFFRMVSSTDTPQIDWPAGLERPEPGPEVVYLDLNHWIGLSRAANGDGRYANALAACSAASESGRAIFPLSSVHYMEVSKIGSRRQRADITAMMLGLSRCRTLISRAQLLTIEREAAIDVVTELSRAYKPAVTPYVGAGVMHTLGRKGAMKLENAPDQMSEEKARARSPSSKTAYPTTFSQKAPVPVTRP